MNGKRLLDVATSVSAIVLTSPLLLLAWIGIRIASPGPAIFKAKRLGLHGKIFVMHKFRTMHLNHSMPGYAISGANDPRVFGLGRVLRKLKIDELPQFYDILRGEMSVVGPRPEDPGIVRDHYSELGMKTLRVKPGLTSPGTIFYYAVGEQLLSDENPEIFYVETLLPCKLSLDASYSEAQSLVVDVQLIFCTVMTIALVSLGFDASRFLPKTSRRFCQDFAHKQNHKNGIHRAENGKFTFYEH